jgi:hypothetical protein
MTSLQYGVGTRVRLTRAYGGLVSGSEGHVIGYYRRDPPAYAVTIAGTAVEIPPEYLEAVDPDGTDAGAA